MAPARRNKTASKVPARRLHQAGKRAAGQELARAYREHQARVAQGKQAELYAARERGRRFLANLRREQEQGDQP